MCMYMYKSVCVFVCSHMCGASVYMWVPLGYFVYVCVHMCSYASLCTRRPLCGFLCCIYVPVDVCIGVDVHV